MSNLFFKCTTGNNHIYLWKNTHNQFVNDKSDIKGKEKYIMRLDKEIKQIINSGFTEYINNYNYKNDSLSSFVIGNLK